MKGDVRARMLMRMLEELPAGISLVKCETASYPPDLATALDDEEGLDERPYHDWLQELDRALAPSQEPGIDLSDIDVPDFVTPPDTGPVWLVSYYDEYGSTYDETNVDLAEDKDVIRALVAAKNRLAAGRKIR